MTNVIVKVVLRGAKVAQVGCLEILELYSVGVEAGQVASRAVRCAAIHHLGLVPTFLDRTIVGICALRNLQQNRTVDAHDTPLTSARLVRLVVDYQALGLRNRQRVDLNTRY